MISSDPQQYRRPRQCFVGSIRPTTSSVAKVVRAVNIGAWRESPQITPWTLLVQQTHATSPQEASSAWTEPLPETWLT